MSCGSASRTGVLVVLLVLLTATYPVTAEPAVRVDWPPTVIRKIAKPELCDGVCLSRIEAERANAIIANEARCRLELDACLDEKGQTVEDGWDPLVVLLVSGAVVALVGGAAFAVGYAVAN